MSGLGRNGGRPRVSEIGEQQAFIDWVHLHSGREEYADLRWLFHVPNGEKRDDVTAARLQSMGVVAGVADYLWLRPGCYSPYSFEYVPSQATRKNYLAIEGKRVDGRQQDNQVAFEEFVRRSGGAYVVCRSTGEYAVTICRYAGWDGEILRTAEELDR